MDSTASPQRAGWYVDPWLLAPARWWDGTGWTAHTTGWRSSSHWRPPVSDDGTCRFMVRDSDESTPTPAELWKRWPTEPRPTLRWWHPQNWSRIAVGMVLVLGALDLAQGGDAGILFAVPAVLLLRWLVWRGHDQPLATASPGRPSASGTVTPRWWPSSSPITATPCVHWEAVLQRRHRRGPGGWRTCWAITSVGRDFDIADRGGRLWIHPSRPAKLRPVGTEFVRAEFDHEGSRYRIIEWGVSPGSEVAVLGLVRPSSLGDLLVSDDLEIGGPRPSPAGIALMPRKALESRSVEIRVAPWVALGLYLVAGGRFSPLGVLLAEDGSWADLLFNPLIVLVLCALPTWVIWRWARRRNPAVAARQVQAAGTEPRLR